MDQSIWNIDLTIVGTVVTIVGIIVGLLALRRRRVAPHWTDLTWTVGAMKVRTTRVPVLTVRWSVRGSSILQSVECAVRSPGGDWQVCAWPKGRLEPPKKNLYTYINLVDGRPFNSTIASPIDHGKPVEDVTHRAIKGKYKLRIRWYEPERPKRRRQKTFSYKVV